MTQTAALNAGYETDGYLHPVDIFNESEASQLRAELEALEARAQGDTHREAVMKNNSNWVIPWFDRLTRNPKVLELVSSILGPDLLALNVDSFIKEAQTPDFISWHQDLHYWGLDSDNEVTVWLALSPATIQSGCMRYLPGSHKTAVDHTDTNEGDNMLSRGQEIAVEVDESKTVYAELQPGQASLHHGRMFHASTPNQTDDRRIGIAMRYISTSMGRASDGSKFGARLVHGKDTFGHFELVDPPTDAFEPSTMDNWKRLRAIEEEILFANTNRKAS